MALPPDELSGVVGELAPVASDGRPRIGEHLLYDHDQILASATDSLRRRYEERPDPDNMLLPPYTLSDLRKLYDETVLGCDLMRDTFNRRAEPLLSLLAAPSGEPASVWTVGVRRVCMNGRRGPDGHVRLPPPRKIGVILTASEIQYRLTLDRRNGGGFRRWVRPA